MATLFVTLVVKVDYVANDVMVTVGEHDLVAHDARGTPVGALGAPPGQILPFFPLLRNRA